MIISSDREGEAAFDCRILRLVIGSLQYTAREKCLLTLIESNGPEFFPVIDQRVFGQDFMNRNLALRMISNCFARGKDLYIHLAAFQLARV